jgi:hypothetical protein
MSPQQKLTLHLPELILCLHPTVGEGYVDKVFAIIGFVFLIAGIMGLFITLFILEWGSDNWIIGNFTFGTFVAVGLGILIGLIVTSE